jgi:hypothetical protein
MYRSAYMHRSGMGGWLTSGIDQMQHELREVGWLEC